LAIKQLFIREGKIMQASRVSFTEKDLLNPESPHWASLKGEKMKLSATPLANQPSEYIKATRDEKKVGKVKEVLVKAVHNGKEIFFYLEWLDAEKNVEIIANDVFPDGASILFPIKTVTGKETEPPIDEMGKKDLPVNAWQWRADLKKAENTWAEGLGTTNWSKKCFISARSQWKDGMWKVVFARPLNVKEENPKKPESVQLAVGKKVKTGFAIWEGSNGERAGLKAFSKEWEDLSIAK
jgi:DMSO reductase family type II enzyme heme b subunit